MPLFVQFGKSAYMVEKGWYHAWDTNEQISLDLNNINTVLNLPKI